MATATGQAGLTLAVLGCGTLGTAILSGIFSSLEDIKSTSSTSESSAPLPKHLPSTFIACVRRPESEKRIKALLSSYTASSIKIYKNENVKACSEADVIILGPKPYMIQGILAEEGMREALAGKLLISICAGTTVEQIEGYLYGESKDGEKKCTVVRAMPNTASAIKESMTVVATSTPSLDEETTSLITWIFERIGKVVYLPSTNMDASTALCGSGPAFFALMLEAAADGAVAMGIPRAEAQRMAAQTMRGAAGLVLAGEHPAVLRDKVSTPGGCTIGGLLVLEEGAIRGTVSRAVREATVVASQLGMGAKNVNGTRH